MALFRGANGCVVTRTSTVGGISFKPWCGRLLKRDSVNMTHPAPPRARNASLPAPGEQKKMFLGKKRWPASLLQNTSTPNTAKLFAANHSGARSAKRPERAHRKSTQLAWPTYNHTHIPTPTRKNDAKCQNKRSREKKSEKKCDGKKKKKTT